MKNNDYDYEYLKDSFREQVMLILWVSLLTITTAGCIIALAISAQRSVRIPYREVIMQDNVVIHDAVYSDSMLRSGWLVIVALTGRDVHYGPFASKEDAIEYGRNMINATIYQLYFPTIH